MHFVVKQVRVGSILELTLKAEPLGLPVVVPTELV